MLQSRLFGASGSPSDWSQLLGMVNVATSQFWTRQGVVTPSAPANRAFVVGINEYARGSEVPRLSKCVNDASDMTQLLEAKGYDVVSLLNASRPQFVTAFNSFCDNLGGAQRVVIHFSGHGVSPANESFLLATDSTRTFGCTVPLCQWRVPALSL
jgi:hypothetical protein